MKIKSKLMLNSVTILILMSVIGVAAVIGIKFIEKNIFYLTQKSTPYQIKTFNHQRALQAHASNLLKVAASDSIDEFKKNSAKSVESLAEEIKAAEELIKLGSSTDYEHAVFTENTKLIQDITGKRLQLQRETLAAVATMKNNLADASKRLQGLDASIRKLQHGATDKMVTNIYTSAKDTNQAAIIADLLDALKDLKIYSIQVMNTTDKEAVGNMYANLTIPLNRMQGVRRITWTDNRADEDFAKRLDTMTDKISDAKDQYLTYLETHDAAARTKAVQTTKEAEKEIVFMLASAKKEAEKSVDSQDKSAEGMSTSVAAFSETNKILIQASEIIFSSSVVDSQINYSLSVKSLPDFDKTVAAIQSEFAKIDATAGKLRALMVKGNFKTESRQLADSLGALTAVKNSFLGKDGAADKIRASLKNVEEVAKLNQKMKEMVAKQMELSSKDVTVAQKSQEGTVASVKAAVNTTTMVIIIIAVMAVLVSLLLGGWIASSITGPIHELSKMAEGFGAGDFNIRMDATRKDEFGTLAGHFNQATAKLTEITKLLKESIGKLSTGSEKLHNTAGHLYKGAQEQVSQTVQSSVAMTEISATVETMAGHAHNSAASSKEAHAMATTGKTVVAGTVRGMHEISDSVIAAATTISKLSESSDRIDSILNTINDIADQTNLLALNAAIEAARAGEQGRGFAVVADEVRKLAQHTAAATHEIADIIHIIQVDTKSSVSAMNEGKAKVEEGMKLSGEASKSLDAIVEVSQRGVDMAQMIATATDDQSKASREVSQSMERIAHITGTLKDSTVEIKEASEQLSSIAEELSRMASWFKVTS
jgi:methyl-accepting chemotaxis protein